MSVPGRDVREGTGHTKQKAHRATHSPSASSVASSELLLLSFVVVVDNKTGGLSI